MAAVNAGDDHAALRIERDAPPVRCFLVTYRSEVGRPNEVVAAGSEDRNERFIGCLSAARLRTESSRRGGEVERERSPSNGDTPPSVDGDGSDLVAARATQEACPFDMAAVWIQARDEAVCTARSGGGLKRARSHRQTDAAGVCRNDDAAVARVDRESLNVELVVALKEGRKLEIAQKTKSTS